MKYIFLTLIFAFTTLFSLADSFTTHQKINWNNTRVPDGVVAPQLRLHFDDAAFDYGSGIDPWYRQKVLLDGNVGVAQAQIDNAIYEVLSDYELFLLDNPLSILPTIEIFTNIAMARNQSYAIVRLLPLRLNMLSGKYEKLVSFDLTITTTEKTKSEAAFNEYASNSVLASGAWYKISVQESGIYKVSYEDMAAMGISISGANSSRIKLFGNGGGMLPEANADYQSDDLLENAIVVVDGGDNTFNPGDYFLFYGKSPNEWVYNQSTLIFDYAKNIYSDYAYYFITLDKGSDGKRVAEIASSTESANYTSALFNDFAVHESDDYNLIKSGRKWVGEIFDLQTSYDFQFNFPNVSTSSEHVIGLSVVAKSSLSSSFTASVNGVLELSMLVSSTPESAEGNYARDKTAKEKINLSSPDVNVNVKYNKSTNNAIGWLDNITLNVFRNLVFTGSQMSFRDVSSVAEGNISQFNLSSAGYEVTVWDVSDPSTASRVKTTASGGSLGFKLATDNLHEFIAFDGSQYLTPVFDKQVPNQNLHGLRDIEYVIISHPDFLDQADRLADFHRDLSGLSVHVTTPQIVFNEFSSGAQDITAIRNMMRMFYERGQQGDVSPRYLLLFGDASYDFKERIQDNTNFVPTFESLNSLHLINSYATDDYFGYLDPEEGISDSDLLDIGIGRFVVRTLEDAEKSVDKVIHYASSVACMGDWRNMITFVADDENNNSHINQAEQLAVFVDTTYPSYNVDKIYIDSYQQETTPGGERYPEVNVAINTSMEKGTLIMNYTGHGGEVGWAHERILDIADINDWSNYDRLSVFVTATCEFTRYDDPGRISAGEYVFLNPTGGGISLFTTARATYGGSNLSLNKGFYKYVFEKDDNGDHYSMGDLIRLAKYESTSSANDKKFILIGDPALKMVYPSYQVHTTSISEASNGAVTDTILALSEVTITGSITDEAGMLVNSFNGNLHSIVYDKESEVTTLGQDETSSSKTFLLRKNVIYKGVTSVIDGEFTFSFIVPKDIAYNYGFGKISYYASEDLIDANGNNKSITIGGFNPDSEADNQGPDIRLYMNDTTFVSGDITHENPVLYARIFDESGINTVGNSIGHDITAILNNDTENPFNLNDFYESDLKGYQSGTVSFPFSNLPGGHYEVRFRIWDVYNNSSEAYLKFMVVDSDQIVINDAYNYPNPFITETWFEYNHNQAGESVDVEIEIFDFNGRLVTTLQQYNTSGGFNSTPIRWDGTAANGNSLSGGIYIYRIQLKSETGQTTSTVKKLVLTK